MVILLIPPFYLIQSPDINLLFFPGIVQLHGMSHKPLKTSARQAAILRYQKHSDRDGHVPATVKTISNLSGFRPLNHGFRRVNHIGMPTRHLPRALYDQKHRTYDPPLQSTATRGMSFVNMRSWLLWLLPGPGGIRLPTVWYIAYVVLCTNCSTWTAPDLYQITPPPAAAAAC